jgi:hypothetical protein
MGIAPANFRSISRKSVEGDEPYGSHGTPKTEKCSSFFTIYLHVKLHLAI